MDIIQNIEGNKYVARVNLPANGNLPLTQRNEIIKRRQVALRSLEILKIPTINFAASEYAIEWLEDLDIKPIDDNIRNLKKELLDITDHWDTQKEDCNLVNYFVNAIYNSESKIYFANNFTKSNAPISNESYVFNFVTFIKDIKLGLVKIDEIDKLLNIFERYGKKIMEKQKAAQSSKDGSEFAE